VVPVAKQPHLFLVGFFALPRDTPNIAENIEKSFSFFYQPFNLNLPAPSFAMNGHLSVGSSFPSF
jgi:hypothetical protein